MFFAKKLIKAITQGRKSISPVNLPGDLITNVLERVDEEDLLRDLGDDLARGALDNRTLSIDPFVLDIKVWRIPVRIEVPRIIARTLYKTL